jgi:hypothetical protein
MQGSFIYTWVCRHLPALFLALCLVAIGVGVHQKTSQAIAPPIYDPMAYYTKGALVWKDWGAGRLVNPFNVDPTVRPPGTMLISAPLGFSPDFRAFFFRSIYVPVVVFVLAFWVIAESEVRQPGQRWANLVGALMLASLPMFYHFERNPAIQSPSDWGYMDCFVGALAALTTALLVLSVRRYSIAIAATGVLAGAFTLLVKPVGLVLFPIFCFLWAVELASNNWPILTALRENPTRKRYAIWTAVLLVASFGATAAVCFQTGYLSEENIRIGYNGNQILIKMFRGVPLWDLIAGEIHTSFAWYWFYTWTSAMLYLLGFALIRMLWFGPRREDFRFLAVFATLLLGIVWWITLAGAAQIRYLYPFPMIFVIIVLPNVLATAYRILPRWARWGLATTCTAPMAIIVALLFASHPALRWQKLVGVNLSTGQFQHEVALGELLVKLARQDGRNPTVYSLSGNVSPGIVESVGIYRNLIDPENPKFQWQRPNDWIHTIMVRRSELVQADYIFFDPVPDAARLQALLTQPVVADAKTETNLFSAWFTQDAEEHGVQIVSDGDLRLVKVIDHTKLDSAFGRLLAQHKWRDEFSEENGKPVLQTQADLIDEMNLSVSGPRDVRFGDKFVLRSTLLSAKDGGLQMRLFWESLAEQPLKYIVFVHVIGQSGKIVSQKDYRQDPGSQISTRLVKSGQIWRDTIQFTRAQLSGATEIAFGLLEPPETFLTPDRGDRDWNNRRLVVPLPSGMVQSQ